MTRIYENYEIVAFSVETYFLIIFIVFYNFKQQKSANFQYFLFDLFFYYSSGILQKSVNFLINYQYILQILSII